jgi:hypothetical protein
MIYLVIFSRAEHIHFVGTTAYSLWRRSKVTGEQSPSISRRISFTLIPILASNPALVINLVVVSEDENIKTEAASRSPSALWPWQLLQHEHLQREVLVKHAMQ